MYRHFQSGYWAHNCTLLLRNLPTCRFWTKRYPVKKRVLSINNFNQLERKAQTVWRKIILFPSSWMFGPAPAGWFFNSVTNTLGSIFHWTLSFWVSMADVLNEKLRYLSFGNRLLSGGKQWCFASSFNFESRSEPVFWNVYGAQELTPRNEFRQPM